MRLLTVFIIALVISLPVAIAERTNLNLDRNGNLISGDGFYREYNGFNQLVTIREGNEANGTVLREFLWDAVEERIESKKTYENGELKEEIIYLTKERLVILNSSGEFYETYVYQHDDIIGEVTTTGAKVAVHPDHLGSVHTRTDSSGNLIDSNFYSPFGEELTEVEARFAYEGKEHDSETGLTDFHFRKYSPEMGRFTQPDTLLPNVFDPQQLSRYAFERNNPLKYTDPDGHLIRALNTLYKKFFNPQKAVEAEATYSAGQDLVPGAQAITDPGSVSDRELNGAILDASMGVAQPIYGVALTVVDTIYMIADPQRFFTDSDYSPSPGERILEIIFGEEEERGNLNDCEKGCIVKPPRDPNVNVQYVVITDSNGEIVKTYSVGGGGGHNYKFERDEDGTVTGVVETTPQDPQSSTQSTSLN